MANETSLPVAVEKREVVYKAFQSEDEVKLNVSIIKNLVATPTKQGDLPGDRDCIRFMLLCRARRLDPFEGDAFLLGFRNTNTGQVDWSLITAHQAFLKRAETHPEFDGMESGVIVQTGDELRELQGDLVPDEIEGEKCKLFGAWAKVHFKHRKIPMYKRGRLTTYQKNYGYWLKDPAGMLVKCLEADALRSSFPTMMGGMYLREEIDISAQVGPAEERRPEFARGTPMPAVLPPTPRAKSRIPEKTAENSVQDASGQQPATPSQPAEQTSAAAAEPPAQAPVEPAATVRNAPENPPAETTAETTVSPEEDLSTPPEQEPPQEAAQGEAPAAFVPDPRDTAPVQNVKRLCHESGLTTDQLMVWVRAKRISTVPGQKLEELAEQKLLNVAKQWATILPIIRQTAAK